MKEALEKFVKDKVIENYPGLRYGNGVNFNCIEVWFSLCKPRENNLQMDGILLIYRRTRNIWTVQLELL